MEAAHRRHEADRAALAARPASAARSSALVADRPHAGTSPRCGERPGALGERPVEVEQLGRRLGDRLEVALDRRLVAARDRPGQRRRAALGPVGGAAQRRAARAARGRPRSRSAEQLGRRLLERDQEVGGDRGGGVVGGALLFGDLEGAHPEPLGQRPGERQRLGVGAADRAGGAGQLRARRRESSAADGARRSPTPRSAAAPGRRARSRRWCGRRSEATAAGDDRRAGFRDRRVGHAEQRHLGICAGCRRRRRGRPGSSRCPLPGRRGESHGRPGPRR